MTRRTMTATLAALSIPPTLSPQVTEDNHLQLCHKDFLQFYRLTFRDTGNKGGWHLMNKEDEQWVRETAAAQDHWTVEFFSLEGKLPK